MTKRPDHPRPAVPRSDNDFVHRRCERRWRYQVKLHSFTSKRPDSMSKRKLSFGALAIGTLERVQFACLDHGLVLRHPQKSHFCTARQTAHHIHLDNHHTARVITNNLTSQVRRRGGVYCGNPLLRTVLRCTIPHFARAPNSNCPRNTRQKNSPPKRVLSLAHLG